MGQTCSKDSQKSVNDDQEVLAMDNASPTDNEYKTRLEQKIVISKENPEPIFDLSDCNLEKLPVSFAFLKVIRKEVLILGKNRLKSLASGGDLKELELLQVLDLSHNRFKAIPAEICNLRNLRELFLSHNQLTRLPPVFNRLRYLELLDISNNDIVDIRSISFVPNLKVLNVSGNAKLEILPPELATNESLNDLIFDIESIKTPNRSVLATTTQNILKFLSTGELTAPSDYAIEDNFLDTKQQSKITSSRIIDESMSAMTRKFLQKEKPMMMVDNIDIDMSELHKEQQRKKEEMLKTLIQQQQQSDDAVNKIQQTKDAERKKLIENIRDYEESSTVVVNELLSLKKDPDVALLELEDKTRDALLEKVHLEQSELRKKDVLSAMSQLLEQELSLITNYNEEKTKSSKVILENETKNSLLLTDVFEEYDKNRCQLVEKINQDEEWQKSAVATLISKNDARSWGLMEQIKIVEAQIAAMTNYEIDKKKINQEMLFNDVAEKRANLTMVLLDLMEQQEKRKHQLLETLSVMENQRTEDDFWLIQYQKLLDQRGVMQNSQASIDPVLGYNFLLNGVIHVVPFLLKIWNTKDFCLERVSDDDLKNAGIKNKKDREGVLKAINEFLSANNNYDNRNNADTYEKPCASKDIETAKPLVPSAPQESTSSTTPSPSSASPSQDYTTNAVTECVVCMDQATKVIFLPCGHLCCCIDCSTDLNLCPMCRSEIERKIKVIQA